jgi:hypothetical protein
MPGKTRVIKSSNTQPLRPTVKTVGWLGCLGAITPPRPFLPGAGKTGPLRIGRHREHPDNEVFLPGI